MRSRRSRWRAATTSTRYALQLLRRRRRPACLPRRRRARHGRRILVHPLSGPALGLWHGPRRHPRGAPGAPSRRRSTRRVLRTMSPAEPRAASRPRRGPRSRRRACLATTISRRSRLHLRYAGTDTALLSVAAGGDEADRGARTAARGASRRAASPALRLRRPGKPHHRRGGVGRGGRRGVGLRRPALPLEYRAARPRPARAHALLLARAPGARRLSYRREGFGPGAPCRRAGPGHRAAPDHRGRAGLARQRHGEERTLLLERVAPRRRRTAIGTDGRSGHAGGVQQPLHVDRRADGRDAAEHRLLGQHQGTAGFFLRRLRCATARSSPMRRTCRCISARWIARSRPIIRLNRGDDAPGRRLLPQRPLQWRHASARHHRGHAGLRRERARTSSSMPPRAATMPMSAASRPARCRRARRGSRRKASISTISSWSIRRRAARGGTRRAAHRRRAIRCATSLQNVNDLKAQVAANEKGVQELRTHGRGVRARGRRRPIWAMSRTMRPRASRA